MGRSWFVQPESVRLELDGGAWVEVKRELSYGDMQQVASASRADLTTANLHIVAAYLLDWSLTDAQDKPVPIDSEGAKLAALRALTNDGFNAIDQVLTTHIRGVQDAKKADRPSGTRKRDRSSGSVGR